MRNLNKLFLVLLLVTSEVFAQNGAQTFQLEKLSKPEKLLPTVTPEKLFANINKNFITLSVTDNLVELGTRPVITGYLRAYQNHYPITLSPDIAWLLICQGFSHHINANSEALRSSLVNFKDKKMLTVVRNVTDPAGIKAFPWETVFPDFVSQISKFTGPQITKNLAADFTTTTPASLISSQITIMESMKEFFNYKVIMVGCGIPEVTIEGSVADWEKISKRLDYLARYDLKWWTSELKPVIQKIIDTKKGKLDKDFWMNMVKYHKTGIYGSYDGIDGWFLKFYPYLEGGRKATQAARQVSKPINNQNGALAGTLKSDSSTFFMIGKNAEREVVLQRSEFKEIKNVSMLPKEMACVPFIFEVQDKSGRSLSESKMEFWAGFMGVRQDPDTFNIKPEIGWAVNNISPK